MILLQSIMSSYMHNVMSLNHVTWMIEYSNHRVKQYSLRNMILVHDVCGLFCSSYMLIMMYFYILYYAYIFVSHILHIFPCLFMTCLYISVHIIFYFMSYFFMYICRCIFCEGQIMNGLSNIITRHYWNIFEWIIWLQNSDHV